MVPNYIFRLHCVTSHPDVDRIMTSTVVSPCTDPIQTHAPFPEPVMCYSFTHTSHSPQSQRSLTKQSLSRKHYTYIHVQWVIAIMALHGQIYQLPRIQCGTVPLAELSYLRAILQ